MGSTTIPKIQRIEELTSRVLGLSREGGRRLVAVTGPPASGKSTVAGRLARMVSQAGRKAEVVPMDGFHLDNEILLARDLLPRKGAPETFDAPGFHALLGRVRKGGEVVFPVFDRTRDLSVAGAGVMEASCDIAVVEGNYLLFDQDPWRKLAPLWDLSIWIEVPESVLLERLIQRWIDHGLPPGDARRRAEGNDMMNARTIFDARMPADVLIGEDL